MPARPSSTTGTTSGRGRSRAGASGPSTIRDSCRRSSARCSARGRGRSGGSRSPETPATSWPPTGPSRICWLGYGERAEAGLRFNELVASGDVSAPIVIGRDHLDAGSVASPYRETEGMADGSDAIADWPVLNALLNTASGATWVSVHHGGGVGIGYSIHAGQVTVADGTPLAAAKLERVLTNDPGTGIVRHVDAGYERAEEVAADHGVRIPMREGGA